MSCSIDGCSGAVVAKGWCDKHYRRMRRSGDPLALRIREATSAESRFWEKVEKRGPDECWPWLGYRNKLGYGYISSGGQRGTMLMAHRVSYEIGNGTIPDGLYVLHGCDNPCCVNPAHLRAGTPKENTHDAINRKRFKNPPRMPGEKNTKAKLTEAQIEFIRHPANMLGRQELARLFEVSPSTIDRVIANRTWKETP